jgi:hypothetical protein
MGFSFGCRHVAGGGAGELALLDEHRVDIGEHPALSVSQPRVGGDRDEHIGAVDGRGSLVEDARTDEERLGRDLQTPGDLLQDLGAGLLQAPLDLRQIGIGDPGRAPVAESQFHYACWS